MSSLKSQAPEAVGVGAGTVGVGAHNSSQSAFKSGQGYVYRACGDCKPESFERLSIRVIAQTAEVHTSDIATGQYQRTPAISGFSAASVWIQCSSTLE